MKEIRRYLMIGAHPDDADIRFGGTALKLVRAGHVVKFVSMCNGDCGHFDMSITPEQLAARRYQETQNSRAVSGISEYQVFHENHDCELMPDLENRKKVIRLKRTAIGCLKLDESLTPGELRELTDEEMKILLPGWSGGR